MSKKTPHDNASAPRRRLLKSLAAGGSALSLTSLPGQWAKPMVAAVILPAHAQTSPGCLGTLNNCPAGYLYSTSSAIPEVNFNTASFKYPGISLENGTLTGSYSTSTSLNVGPCPSPCDNVDGRKYVSKYASFGDRTANIDFSFEVHCGGEPIGEFALGGSGTSDVGNKYTYTGDFALELEACKYISPGSVGLDRQLLQRGRRFRFGGD